VKRPFDDDLLTRVYGWFTEGFDTRDLKEAKALLLEHLPEIEAEAITLPSLWVQPKPATNDKPAVPAGPLADSKVSKNTFYRAAEALIEAGNVAQHVISARKTVWWCVSHARDPLGHTLSGPPGASADASVSRAPSLKKGHVGYTHSVPESTNGHSDLLDAYDESVMPEPDLDDEQDETEPAFDPDELSEVVR